MRWVAHRGASHDAPENTLAAARLAWEQGADAVEVDVRLTADEEIVVFHDADLMRICGREERVAELTLDELRRLDAGAWKGEAWKGEPIPTLAEVLETVPKGGRLLVEIKAGREILSPLSELLNRKYAFPDCAIPIGFDLDIVAAVKLRQPGLSVLWVHDMNTDSVEEGRFAAARELAAEACARNLDGLDVRACAGVNKRFADEVRSADLALYVWTVDEPEEARRMIDAGITGLTTNRPGWLKASV